MALVKRQSNSTRAVVVLLVAIVVGAVGYFLAKQYFASNSGANANSTGTTTRPVITNFGESILNDSRYTELQPYGTNISVNVNTDAGQPEPFQ